MSDTPRTDDQECDMFVGVSTFTPSDIQQAFDFARQLEREINAANDRIMLLEEAGISAIHEAIYGREDDALEIWRKAMEAKP